MKRFYGCLALFSCAMFQLSMAMVSTENINEQYARALTPLHQAVLEKNVEGVKGLLNSGADTEAMSVFYPLSDNTKQTPLFSAVEKCCCASEESRKDCVKIVTLLLERGANPNARATSSGDFGTYDELPLHESVRALDVEIVKLLLAFGANPCEKSGASFLGRVLSIVTGDRDPVYTAGDRAYEVEQGVRANKLSAGSLMAACECRNIIQLAQYRWHEDHPCSCTIQ